MKQKLFRYSSWIAAILFVLVFFGLAIENTPESTAVKATDFKAGRIIDDSVFFNKDSMTVEEIQAHLDKYLPTCDMWGTGAVGSGRSINGKAVAANTTRADYAKMMYKAGNSKYHDPPYVCVNKYYENPKTHENLFDTKGVIKDGMISAAQIIYNEAQEYGINPQVLLVMLKKESYVWGDNWPLRWEYNTVMGFGCPDTAPCNEAYYGFQNQIHLAARQFTLYKKYINAGYYNYKPFKTNKIYYNPDYSCGQKSVYLENFSTTFLYIYTPYTPNDAALKNYPGTATCGSYGNRNFFMYFNEWFGPTLESFSNAEIENGKYTIKYGDDEVKLGKLEEFTISGNKDSSYKLNDPEQNLALSAAAATEGSVIKTEAISQADTQIWKIVKNKDNTYSFLSAANETLAITYDAASKGFKLTIFAKNKDQKFTLTKVETPAEEPIDNETPSEPGNTSGSSEPEKPGETTPVVDEKPENTTQPEQKPAETPKVPERTIADGTYVFTSKLNSKSSITVYNSKTANRTGLVIYKNSDAGSQQFKVKYDTKTGYYTITGLQSNKSLDITGNKMVDGNTVMINTADNSCAQKWLILKNSDGSYSFASSCNNKYVLGVKDAKTANNTKVLLYKSTGANAQKFSVKKIVLPVEEGKYYIKSALNNNYAIDIKAGKYINGQTVQIYKNKKLKSQQLQLKYNVSCKCYNIVSNNTKMYLGVNKKATYSGAFVRLQTGNNNTSQQWKISKNSDGTYTIKGVASGKVLSLSKNSLVSGSNITIRSNAGQKSQKWILEPVK